MALKEDNFQSRLENQHSNAQSTDQQQRTLPQNYRFTPEEFQVLRQCNRESFYQRSLPLSSVLGIGTFYGVQAGYLKPNPRWGAYPKVFLAAAVGYFIGKFSYQKKCAEKLMALPNSPIGELLRQKRKGGFQETLTMDPGFGTTMSPLPSFGGASDMFSDTGPQYDLDSSRPYTEGLDDSLRLTVDSPLFEEDNLPTNPPAQTTTYEELRRRNREEYEQKDTQQYRGVTGVEGIPSTIRNVRPSVQIPNQSRNEYGDVWEKTE